MRNYSSPEFRRALQNKQGELSKIDLVKFAGMVLSLATMSLAVYITMSA